VYAEGTARHTKSTYADSPAAAENLSLSPRMKNGKFHRGEEELDRTEKEHGVNLARWIGHGCG
jgi:hypothetical protein